MRSFLYRIFLVPTVTSFDTTVFSSLFKESGVYWFFRHFSPTVCFCACLLDFPRARVSVYSIRRRVFSSNQSTQLIIRLIAHFLILSFNLVFSFEQRIKMSATSATAAAPKYSINDLVWAKMKGFSPWPGKVADPSTTKLKKPAGNYRYKNVYCIYFFGSNNFAWIPEDSLKPFEEFKGQYSKMCKSSSFKEALNKIELFIKNGTLDELKAIEDESTNDKSDDGECVDRLIILFFETFL